MIGTGSALRGAVLCFYLSNEGLSLLENAAHLGLPVPGKLKDVLSQLHNRNEKSDDANDGKNDERTLTTATEKAKPNKSPRRQ